MANAAMSSAGRFSGARWLNLALGVWLFISAFVWPHTAAARTNTWILGIIIAGCALAATVYPAMRVVSALAAAWLFISTLVISHASSATPWNNCIVAAVVFVASMIGGERLGGPMRTQRRTMSPA